MKSLILFFAVAMIVCGFCISGKAQDAIPPQPSPNAIATLKYEDTYIKITYCQPHKRGRTTFGGMIPYGKVWRTGANEATEITVTQDILIGGQRLKAGTYSLFSIPDPQQWVIIFNRVLGQWGAYEYDSSNDIMRIKANCEHSEVAYEPFTISFEQTESKTHLVFRWDTTKVLVPIQFI